jgi:hypothetical protein
MPTLFFSIIALLVTESFARAYGMNQFAAKPLHLCFEPPALNAFAVVLINWCIVLFHKSST